ncbi:MAG TPA: chromosomal replication initiator protein DnaA, partial [Firmicutes bacterium]|nr:chromosomal replication initiator protein DnaA [Bacillota bacterium]
MSESLSSVWHAVLIELENHLNKPSLETWFKNSKPVSMHNKTFVLEVPNDFTRNWLIKHYYKTLTTSLQKILKEDFKIHIILKQDYGVNNNINNIVEKNISKNTIKNITSKNISADIPVKTGFKDLSSVCKWLNPKYTFNSFVVGSNNRLTHAASLAVAETPSRAYNPLFIYGGVGLGKTHILHAIGHYVISHNISEHVVYLSSEKFTNQFINAIRDNKTVDFRNKYRNIDILLIDDIQFLGGKEETQEEFFHTFNALHENSKQ